VSVIHLTSPTHTRTLTHTYAHTPPPGNEGILVDIHRASILLRIIASSSLLSVY